MRTAVISDIHANLEALQAVLDQIDTQNVDRIICLGDILGYGPSPVQCVDLVAERCEWSLMGNHDFGVLYEPTNFNVAAEQAAYWSREQFELESDNGMSAKRWEFLSRLRVRVLEDDFLYVHGTPRRPINEYLFPEDALNSPVKMQQIFELVDKYALVGHTHVPGVFTDEPDFYPPDDLDGVYKLEGEDKAIINPGSVGQPRDLDPRASYIIIEDDCVRFFRLEYDIDAVASKIRATPQLLDWLGERLYEGR
ncbi:MAG: metallophosphoesterase family protein [Planctomycetes bacterium]|nr:metallophosphoesterase family protein [Planctomycetota bacterium]MCH8211388.1 metallophosphoesterase family protein [Planctomycetota bacterium]MCH8261366.1 metallophosphoesterase family protein [Planctomycetota bacterium]